MHFLCDSAIDEAESVKRSTQLERLCENIFVEALKITPELDDCFGYV